MGVGWSGQGRGKVREHTHPLNHSVYKDIIIISCHEIKWNQSLIPK